MDIFASRAMVHIIRYILSSLCTVFYKSKDRSSRMLFEGDIVLINKSYT